jgi:hypothetical protein
LGSTFFFPTAARTVHTPELQQPEWKSMFRAGTFLTLSRLMQRGPVKASQARAVSRCLMLWLVRKNLQRSLGAVILSEAKNLLGLRDPSLRSG